MSSGKTISCDSSATGADRTLRGYERATSTRILLAVGAVTAVLFIVVLLIEGALRSGYDPTYHTGSMLTLGDRGWIQIANFLQLGLGMLVLAIGVHRTLSDIVGSALLGIFGLGLVASGVFRPDPMRGFPPGTPQGTPDELTWHAQIHDFAGPIAFIALLGASLALSRRLQGRWRFYTLATAAMGFAFTVGTAAAWQSDFSYTGLVQRGLIVVYLSWIALLGTHLVRQPRTRDTSENDR